MLSTTTRLLPTTTALFRVALATPRFHLGTTPNFVRSTTFNRAFATGGTATTGESDPDFAPKSKVDTEDVHDKISKLVHDNRVVLFMKGSPAAPKCGFSKAVCAVLSAEGLTDFTYVDCLKSDAVREGIKKYSEWPTIPQLYVDGEFLGGYDIIVISSSTTIVEVVSKISRGVLSHRLRNVVIHFPTGFVAFQSSMYREGELRELIAEKGLKEDTKKE